MASTGKDTTHIYVLDFRLLACFQVVVQPLGFCMRQFAFLFVIVGLLVWAAVAVAIDHASPDSCRSVLLRAIHL